MNSELEVNDLKSIFQQRFSKQQTIWLTHEIIKSRDLFDELISIIIRNEPPFSIGPSWVMGYAGIERPAWYILRLPELLESLKPRTHQAVYRSIVSVLRKIEIPESLEGMVTDYCIRWVEDVNQSIAVKSFSLHILSKIMEKQPELCPEIKLITENLIPFASSGLMNTAEKVLLKIRSMGF
jgi:hypothetical protein